MNGNWASLLTVLALAIVHVYAGTVSVLHRRWHSRTLSAAAGISVAYVFLELMPALAGAILSMIVETMIPGKSAGTDRRPLNCQEKTGLEFNRKETNV